MISFWENGAWTAPHFCKGYPSVLHVVDRLLRDWEAGFIELDGTLAFLEAHGRGFALAGREDTFDPAFMAEIGNIVYRLCESSEAILAEYLDVIRRQVRIQVW
jgi:hypothetical protein